MPIFCYGEYGMTKQHASSIHFGEIERNSEVPPKDYYADGVNIRYLKPQSPGYDDTEMTGLKFRCRYPSKVPKRSPFMRDFGASGWVSNILPMIHCPR